MWTARLEFRDGARKICRSSPAQGPIRICARPPRIISLSARTGPTGPRSDRCRKIAEEGLGAAIMDRLRARRLLEPLMRQAGLNESLEERMRLVRFALKFGVILAGEEIRMIAQLDQFRERAVG